VGQHDVGTYFNLRGGLSGVDQLIDRSVNMMIILQEMMEINQAVMSQCTLTVYDPLNGYSPKDYLTPNSDQEIKSPPGGLLAAVCSTLGACESKGTAMIISTYPDSHI